MPFSLRFDAETEALIDRLSRQTGRSRASIVREAVVQYGAAATEKLSAYDRLEPLIGVIRSGRGDLSRRTGKTFSELLKKQRARRARRAR
jgi:hypothetical protein